MNSMPWVATPCSRRTRTVITVAMILWLAAWLPARAGEIRVARFDIQRVFSEYQHTKDLQPVQTSKNDPPPSKLDDLQNTWKAQQKDIAAAKVALARATEENGEQRQQQLDAALLAAKETERYIQEFQWAQNKELEKKALENRALLLKEIREMAVRIGTEKHCLLIFPTNDENAASVITTAEAEDITEFLLARLNAEYAKKKKP